MEEITGKKIAVLGLGIEGVSSALFLNAHGAEVTVLDQKKESEASEKLQGTQIKVKLGHDAFEDLEKYDVVVRSPGIKLSELSLEPSKITSQTKLFFDLCPGKIIGVTGTKGKGTTSTLIYEMLKKEGKEVYLGGNIGVPPFDFLDVVTSSSWVVLELSSFQLQDLTKSPHIGVVLMITSEHLDYHRDVYEYVDAKRNLIRFQTKEDKAVLNRDYPASNESDVYTDASVYRVSRERDTQEGCYIKDKKVYIKVGGKEEEIIDISEIRLAGTHNLENVCAAVMACFLSGVKKKTIQEVLRGFKGLEHRLELVGVANGVEYYNDSFSTIPETAIAAIESFEEPKVLILGGSSKKSDFSELSKVIGGSKSIRAIIGIGDEWEEIKTQLKNQNVQCLLIEGATTMKQIVTAASKVAKPGDVVLLSPACASFGMFENYKDRGNKFKQEVREIVYSS